MMVEREKEEGGRRDLSEPALCCVGSPSPSRPLRRGLLLHAGLVVVRLLELLPGQLRRAVAEGHVCAAHGGSTGRAHAVLDVRLTGHLQPNVPEKMRVQVQVQVQVEIWVRVHVQVQMQIQVQVQVQVQCLTSSVVARSNNISSLSKTSELLYLFSMEKHTM